MKRPSFKSSDLDVASPIAKPDRAIRIQHVYFDVAIRADNRATLHAVVYENPTCTSGITALAIHGLSEVASMFGPLALALCTDRTLGERVQRVVALDMVAHGFSSPPTLQQTFGTLSIEDNASVLIQTVNYLSAIDIQPDMLIGHGLGGLGIQSAQQTLLTRSSSLRELGVTKAVLLASVPAGGTAWTQIQERLYESEHLRFDAQLGAILDTPADRASSGFLTLRGSSAHGTPSLDTFLSNRWSSPEPFATVLQLSGTHHLHGKEGSESRLGRCRPFVGPRAFASNRGTKLSVVGFSQDAITPLIDQDDLYEYLTGESSESDDSLFIPVIADDAVHSMFVSSPRVVVESLRRIFEE